MCQAGDKDEFLSWLYEVAKMYSFQCQLFQQTTKMSPVTKQTM